jgi:hypothetical protein
MEQIRIVEPNTRWKLFALWLFILLNIIFRDIHQMTLKSHLEMLLTGYFNGMEVTDTIMLFGAIIVNIPISMLLVSLFVKVSISRILNIIAAVVLTASFLLSPPTDMDDVFHLVVELGAIAAIIFNCVQWKAVSAQPQNL